jgi:hypothetical protein
MTAEVLAPQTARLVRPLARYGILKRSHDDPGTGNRWVTTREHGDDE